MGNEAKCTVWVGKQRSEGKALLETSGVIFRASSGDYHLKIPFRTMMSVKAAGGELCIEFPGRETPFSPPAGKPD